MDSLTHAFVVSLALPSSAPSLYLFTLVLGAIIPDVDILFKPLSDDHPSLFILTHGGFTHSIAGAGVVAGLAWIGIIMGSMAGAFSCVSKVQPVLLLIIFTGTCTHLFLDSLAFPGIPLLYPVSLKKFTLGIFPGPSIVLFAASILFAVLMAGGTVSGSPVLVYTGFFLSFVLLSAGIRCFARSHTSGMLIPTFHPLRWLVVRDENSAYILERYDLFRGTRRQGVYAKSRGLDPRDLQRIEDLPEVRRHRFYSYIVVAERTGDGILLKDPLRSERFLFYPPYYTKVIVQELKDEKSG